MIDRLIGFSIRNKLIIGFFIIALFVWGVFSLKKLHIDAVPDITNNQVQILTQSPTLAAQEVEQFITYPIEISMANLPDVTEIRSISRFGLSVVTVVFKDEVNINLGRQLVSERIKIAQEQIPPGLGTTEMAPLSTGLSEIYQYVLHTKPGFEKKYSPMDLRTMQDWIVKRQLAGTPGIAEISSLGGYLKEYEVRIHPEKLIGMHTTLQEIFNALGSNNENTGGAYIEKSYNAYFIRGIGLVSSLEDIERIVVKNINGVPLLIRDVAEVQFGSAVRYGAMTRNGEGEVVGGVVLMYKGANANEVVENVKSKMDVIQRSLPEGVVIEPFLDRSKLVNKAISTVSTNLIEGGIIVIFILVLLLGNLRAGLIVASVIPLAMLFAISMMQLFGISGNLMSLGAIDFGLIVDGAVIIVESIVHRVHTSRKLKNIQLFTQKQMDDVVYDASTKIRHSAAFGEIIILMVYLPILTLSDIEGKMFKPMAEVVCFAILGALILSLTYVPMMSALFLDKKHIEKITLADRIMGFLEKKYEPLLRFALKKKMAIIATAVVLFLTGSFVFSRMGGEFIPTLEEGDFAIESAIAPGSSLQQTIETMTKAEKILLSKFPEVEEVVSKIGTGEIPTDPMPIESGDIMVILKDKSDWTSAEGREELAEKMEEALAVIPGARFDFQQPIQMRFNELMTGVKSDVAVKIYGDDLNVLQDKGFEVEKLIRKIEGTADVKVERVKGLPQIVVNYKRDRIAQYGLNIAEVNNIIKASFAGSVAGVVYEGQKRFNLVVRMEEAHRKELKDVRNLYISLPNGAQIPLYEIADVDFKEGAMQISRDDTKRRITVGLNVRNRDVESVVNEIRGNIEKNVKLPPGYYFEYGGQFENLNAARERLYLAVPIALGIILVLLYLTFNSIKQSLLIFTAIPLAAVGGIFALMLRGMPFSISAGVGFIALFGVAVLNGIVMIGYLNQLKKDGISNLEERIFTGTRTRLRPVIMTAAVASLGFLPMALSTSEGAEVQKPLATVVIGGLITSTLLTLILLPVLYSLVEEKFNKGKTVINPGGMILLFLLMLPGLSLSQSEKKVLKLDEAVSLTLKRSPAARSGNLDIQMQKELKKTRYDLNKTSITGSYGRFNSLEYDDEIGISQTIPFPALYNKNKKLSEERIKNSEYLLLNTNREQLRDVKIVFFRLLSALDKYKMLLSQDSLSKEFSRAAALRYKSGESTYLEMINAESIIMEIHIAKNIAESRVNSLKTQLRIMTGITEDFVLEKPTLKPILKFDSIMPTDIPKLQAIEQQVRINVASAQVERAKLYPEISMSGLSQSNKQESRSTRFNYIQGGLGIPIFYGTQKAKAKSAEIGSEMAKADFEYQKMQMEIQYQELIQEYYKYRKSIDYYEQKGLEQSDLIVEYAKKSYDEGEISYIAFIQNMTQAMDIKLGYIDAMEQYYLAYVNLEFITGEIK